MGPVGTPAVLIPVIVIIETIRNLIRPGALAVRLAANIVAGHLLLSLLGGQGAALRISLLCGLIIGLVLLIVLVCSSMYSGIRVYNFKYAVFKRADKSRV